MKRKLTLLLAAGLTSTAAFAAGYAGSATTTAVPAKVAVARSPLGRILVDARGRTLYLFQKDRGAASSCYGPCAGIWPPLTTKAKPLAGPGVLASRLGTTKRKDGKLEVTYNRHPLYYYAGDTKVGDTTGQGLDQFGAEWYVLSPAGTRIDRS